MAEIWYNMVPCCCAFPNCEQTISATPKVETSSVVVSVRARNGKRTDIVLSAGWARVLAANIEQAANRVRPKIAPKPLKSEKASRNGNGKHRRDTGSRSAQVSLAR